MVTMTRGMRGRLAFTMVALLTVAWPAAAQSGASPGSPASQRSGYDSEGAVIEQARTVMRFESNGTGTREVYLRVHAQSDAGVQQWGQVVLGYSAASESIDIPLVRVTKADGSVVTTPSSAIQDLSSPVQRVAPVYTDFREKHVTVDSFRPGDTLEVRYVTTIHTPLAPGEFWGEYDFNEAAIVLDEQLDLDLPADRKIILRTRPGHDPTIVDRGGRRVYHWASSHKTREEPDKKDAKDKTVETHVPSVRFTSFTDWQQVGSWFGALEASARKPTPEVQAKARELVAGKATDLDKLESLYGFVSQNFRYVSLSLGAGRYQPRPAADVLRDQYGDCKDKHTLLASLIDAAGLHASAVLIHSQEILDPDFPSPSQFDHVITRAELDGQPVWLDATPEVAPFRYLQSAIRGKQALLVDGGHSRLVRTPDETPIANTTLTKLDGKVDDTGALTAHVELSLRGDLELPTRYAFRLVPAAQWKDILDQVVKTAGLTGDVSDWKVSNPQATRDPFTITFALRVPSFVSWGPKNVTVMPPLAGSGERQEVDEEDTDPVKLPAGTVRYELHLEFPSAVTPQPVLPVNVVRDYGEYHSTCSVDGAAVSLERSLVLKQPELPADRRGDYAAFVRVMNGVAAQRLSLESTLPAAPASEAASSNASELNMAGWEALQARDYERAVKLLSRVVELEPKDRTAWNNLGSSLLALKRTDEAIAAFKKQIEVNAFDEYAYNNLGRAYRVKGDYDEAERAFLKQAEVNPLDRYAFTNLGNMYLDRHQYDKAAETLAKAASVNPESADIQVSLGRALLNAHRDAEATAAFDRAVTLSPTPNTWNSIAYELSLHASDLTRAQRYAESAISAVSALSRNMEIAHVDDRAVGTVVTLAAYWDTLGWVYFAKGNVPLAEKYVAASWALQQQSEVGDHLGQIYEKEGRREDAARLYAQAMSAEAPIDGIRDHLRRVADAGRIDALIADNRGQLVKSRTLTLSAGGPSDKHADFFILIGQPGRVEGVKFVSGDKEMEPLGAAIQKLQFASAFPDDQPAKLVRRGIAACTASGCTLTLLLPSDTRAADR